MMRATFHQYFRPTKQEMDAMLAEALICYDANVLLNVYRYSEETQRGLDLVFKAFADRTRLPHQFALEYAQNRLKTIVEQVNLCQDAEKAFEKVETEYITPKDRQPFLSPQSAAALKQIKNELAQKRRTLESMISEDHYADLLLSLFEEKIGETPDAKTLELLHEQAAIRYKEEIPPGYGDLKTKSIPRAYGDYVAWRQLMDIATREKKDFILVSDDSKEDWRVRLSGKTVGPRPELLEEFRRETGQRVWLFSSEGFLVATKEAGSAQVADSVIKEVSAHLVAQTSVLASDAKLSDSHIEREDLNPVMAQDKLFSPRFERGKKDALASEAAARQTKVTTPGEETSLPTDKRMADADEYDGGEE